MLIPRMTQVQRDLIAGPAEGLIVYQTDGAEGFYYRDNGGWYLIGSDVTAWSLQGNANTNPATNFIGATDNVALRFKTNNTDRMTIAGGGNVGIGTTTPTFRAQIAQDITYVEDIIGGSGQLGLTGAADTLKRMVIGYGGSGNGFGFIKAGRKGIAWTNLALQPHGGNVGIGTTEPKAPLHVATKTSASPFLATSTLYNRMNPSNVVSANGGLNGVNINVSIISEGDIVANGVITSAQNLYFSDARLKNVEGLSNSILDLALLEQIKVTDYTMKDRVTWGHARYKKVIAQEVEAVYPQAVKKTTGYLPDVYDFAVKVEKSAAGYLVTMGKPMACVKGNKVRLELENKGMVEAGIARVLNDRQFEITSEADLTTGTLFVYGMQVDDLRTVDYDAISMLNVSATQEIARQLKSAQARIEALEKENTDMKAEIGIIKSYLNIASRK
jgi:hypothetical protein